jgi:hypothetical protein
MVICGDHSRAPGAGEFGSLQQIGAKLQQCW